MMYIRLPNHSQRACLSFFNTTSNIGRTKEKNNDDNDNNDDDDDDDVCNNIWMDQ